MFAILIIPLLFYPKTKCDSMKYSNYTLFHALPDNAEKVEFLKNIEYLYDANYWKFPGELNRRADFVISPNKKDDFIKEASRINLRIKAILSDVQR